MKTKFILILTLAVLVLVPVNAKPESITIAPYKVSFDLGNVSTYSITTKSLEGMTYWGIPYTSYIATITGISSIIIIRIYDYYGIPMDASLYEAAKTLRSDPNCGELFMTAMIIDGKPGVVGKVDCRNSTRYAIDYPIDYSARDNTMTSVAYIVSTFPWDNGTSNLAKTIHIEKSLPYHTIYIVTPS